MNYAKRYYRCLLNGDLSELTFFGDDKRVHIMKSLAALSKFLGLYDEWKMLVRKYGLKWNSRSSLEAFVSILNFNIESVKEWLIDVIQKIPQEYAAYEVYTALTGLRPVESLNSINLILHLYEANRINEYFNENLLMLEHFRYPKIFLRRCKAAYISFVSKDLLLLVMTTKPRIKYPTLQTKIRRIGLPNKTKHLRKLYATILRNNGIPSEVIDILQGRINSSIFLRFYYKPFLKEIREKVMEAIRPLEQEILSYF